MTFNSVLFCKYVIFVLNKLKEKDTRYEYDITKINKLMYIIYGFYWSRKQLRLFDEQPKLWPYGPVFPKVYNYIKKNGFEFDADINISNKNAEFFEKIIKTFGLFKTGKLLNWSHSKGSPWESAKKKEIKKYGKTQWIDSLNDNEIKEYFSNFDIN